jgi:hypothetical protein
VTDPHIGLERALSTEEHMSYQTDLQDAMDPAVELTISYLTLLEVHLKISINDRGQPVCIYDDVSAENVATLKSKLRELLNGEPGLRAIDWSKQFGRDHIQSIAFGHADNLDALVKLGLVCGDRVILWDVLSSRILVSSESPQFTVDMLVEVACNLLLLRSIVRSGGLVVLPHPVTWSALAQNVERELAMEGNPSSRSLGLSLAVSAIDEGIPMHPYTLFTRGEVRPGMPAGTSAVLSDSNASYQAAVSLLLKDREFEFLADIPAASFFEISKKYPDLHRSLRKHFASLAGMSLQQRSRESTALVEELRVAIKKREKAMLDYAIDAGIASAGLFAGALTLATSITGATVMAGLGLAPTAMSVVRRWFNRPDRPVIVQAFAELEASKPPAPELLTPVQTLTEHEAPAELAQHVRNLMELPWTEDKHNYLAKLDDEVSRKICEALLPEQIQVLVNFRRFQEDYIGDYLEYLWEVSELAFWRHIEQTFLSDDGMLMYDGRKVHQVLINSDMPISVWTTLLQSIPRTYREPLLAASPLTNSAEKENALAKFQAEQLAEVLSFQLMDAGDQSSKQQAFIFWLGSVGENDSDVIRALMKLLFPDGQPDWLIKSDAVQRQ